MPIRFALICRLRLWSSSSNNHFSYHFLDNYLAISTSGGPDFKFAFISRTIFNGNVKLALLVRLKKFMLVDGFLLGGAFYQEIPKIPV